MIVTVSTVKDSPANVRGFVERNLSAGADHMFVFLDVPDPAVAEHLGPQEHVTLVQTGPEYWQGRRPASLNARQTVNANVVKTLLVPFDWAQWLLHIDGDECLDIDRERLLAVEPTAPAVHLDVLEAVSIAEGGWDNHFKRRLSTEELGLLHMLGVIDQPRNIRYFNGYVHGKGGVRPSLSYTVGIHRSRFEDSTFVEPLSADFLRVLHFDSFSLEEFTRKWTNMVNLTGSGYSPKKQRMRDAVGVITSNPALSEAQRATYLEKLYRRHVADDVETLHDLGLLVQPPPERHGYRPTPMTAPRSEELQRLLGHLVRSDKRYFRPNEVTFRTTDLLSRLARDLRSEDRGLARRVKDCAARAGR
ncbi:MAG: glycosyltransferase family 2 protein [Nocardioidaceae bacterium]